MTAESAGNLALLPEGKVNNGGFVHPKEIWVCRI